MVNLLRRRAMMAQAAAPSLIKFDDRTNVQFNPSESSQYMTVSDGNHFYFDGRRRGGVGTAYVNITDTQNAAPSGWPPILSFSAGDEITMKLKNVTVKCGQTASKNGYAQVTLRSASNVSIMGWEGNDSTSPLYVVGQQTKTYDELVTTATIESDVDFCILRFYEYGTAQAINIDVTCDLEVYVNGIRKI